jgi:hypothetical protein
VPLIIVVELFGAGGLVPQICLLEGDEVVLDVVDEGEGGRFAAGVVDVWFAGVEVLWLLCRADFLLFLGNKF